MAVAGVVRVSARAPTRSAVGRIDHLGNGHGPRRDQTVGMPITGDSLTVAERLDEYRRAGADHVVLGILGDNWERRCELLADARALLV